jgi:hypothetical protein
MSTIVGFSDDKAKNFLQFHENYRYVCIIYDETGNEYSTLLANTFAYFKLFSPLFVIQG